MTKENSIYRIKAENGEETALAVVDAVRAGLPRHEDLCDKAVIERGISRTDRTGVQRGGSGQRSQLVR